MRILVAGASGAIELRLIPLLVTAGHRVTGLIRSPSKAEPLRRAGATAAVVDAPDPPELREAVLAHATAAGMPEARAADVMLVVHELAANAVRHGAGASHLRMWAGPARHGAARSTTPARQAWTARQPGGTDLARRTGRTATAMACGWSGKPQTR